MRLGGQSKTMGEIVPINFDEGCEIPLLLEVSLKVPEMRG